MTPEQIDELHQSLVEWEGKIDEVSSDHQVYQRRFFILNMVEITRLTDQYKEGVPDEKKKEFGLNTDELVRKLLALGK
ncbi:MAG: hypothetical protein CMB80_05365 [Flammeovirgaceae bacterium]|nr:hypothetical protein [Flammeovirgaceae bacterium]MAH32747.1 hypothetical protein [Marinobacter sp.]|tara:strand:- start:377 stop:610 length:234 start_codon:yes stop_codon:yes gene_type:complete